MGWGDMDRKLQAAMAAKSPPTASHTQSYVVTSFRAKGLIEPVDDVVKAIGEDKIFPLGAPVAQVSGRQVLGHHACVGRRDLRRPRRLLAGHRGESAELADVGRLAPRPAQAQ